MKSAAVLGLGSNSPFVSGENVMQPCLILQNACRALSKVLSGIRFSCVYETEPMYVTDQNRFYNMAAAGFFDGSPLELLDITQKIECDYGRRRESERRFGPRTLDIDIELFYGQVINTERLEIPHPRLCERAFILAPMLEILPFFADSKERVLYEHCLKKIGLSGVKKFCSPFVL